MRTLKNLMALALIAASGIQAQAADVIDPSVQIDIYFAVCPAIEAGPAVWGPRVQSDQDFLNNQSAQAPAIVPDRFHQITLGAWQYLCVDDATSLANNTGMWLGQLVPGSAQRGNGISAPCRVISPNFTFSLDDLTITTWLWNVAGSTNVSTFDRYYPEAWGKTVNGTMIDSGPTSQQCSKFGYVGWRKSFTAHDQPGLNLISNYVKVAISGMSSMVELRRGGVVVARRQVDLPFSADAAQLAITQQGGSGATTLTVQGKANQFYGLQSSSDLKTWLPFGTPVLSGSPATVAKIGGYQFVRALQGP